MFRIFWGPKRIDSKDNTLMVVISQHSFRIWITMMMIYQTRRDRYLGDLNSHPKVVLLSGTLNLAMA